jgi:methyl-accepting chemotaxis protein
MIDKGLANPLSLEVRVNGTIINSRLIGTIRYCSTKTDLPILMIHKNSDGVKDLGIQKTGEVMLEDQKAKIQVASHSAAMMAGVAIEGISNKEQVVATIRKLVDKIRFESDKSGYFFVYEETVNVALPPNKEIQGKDLGKSSNPDVVKLVTGLRDAAKEGGGFYQYIWPKPGAGDTPKLGYAEMIPGTNMWIGTGVYLDNIDATKAQMSGEIESMVSKRTTTMLVVCGIIFGVIIALCLFIAFGIVGALKQMIASFQDIAEGEGDLTKRIQIKSKDEIAELAHWFNTFLEKLQGMIQQIAGNATSVDRSSAELSEIATMMTTSAGETSSRADNVAASTEERSPTTSPRPPRGFRRSTKTSTRVQRWLPALPRTSPWSITAPAKWPPVATR